MRWKGGRWNVLIQIAPQKKNSASQGIVDTPNVSHKRGGGAHHHFAIALKQSMTLGRRCLVIRDFYILILCRTLSSHPSEVSK
jgi:hypothetical protein